MIQDIAPHSFHNEYKDVMPKDDDYILSYHDGSIYMATVGESIRFPAYQDLHNEIIDLTKCVYGFSIDENRYFILYDTVIAKEGMYHYTHWNTYRDYLPMHHVLAASVGAQLGKWYSDHIFCGKCAGRFVKSTKERALVCPDCGQTIYPVISPSVIVGITCKDRLLLTKYAYGPYKNYALVAGYSEIGESMEQTVIREVMEEVSLKVKNIRYYKSQPWPCSSAMLMGYFCEADGSSEVVLQEEELSEGTWFTRDELPETSSTISLTNEMIEYFRNNEDKFR